MAGAPRGPFRRDVPKTARRARLADASGDAKVADQRLSRKAKENIGRLDVVVHPPGGVNACECGGQWRRPPGNRREPHDRVGGKLAAQRPELGPVHCQPPLVRVDVEYAHDPRAGQSDRNARLVQELSAIAIGPMVHLERDSSAKGSVKGFVHRTRPAPADFPQKFEGRARSVRRHSEPRAGGGRWRCDAEFGHPPRVPVACAGPIDVARQHPFDQGDGGVEFALACDELGAHHEGRQAGRS
jgi:hypothetical protein